MLQDPDKGNLYKLFPFTAIGDRLPQDKENLWLVSRGHELTSHLDPIELMALGKVVFPMELLCGIYINDAWPNIVKDKIKQNKIND